MGVERNSRSVLHIGMNLRGYDRKPRRETNAIYIVDLIVRLGSISNDEKVMKFKVEPTLLLLYNTIVVLSIPYGGKLQNYLDRD